MSVLEKKIEEAEEAEDFQKELDVFGGNLRKKLPKRKLSEAEEIGEIILLAQREGWVEEFMDLTSFFNLKNAIFPRK